jgi:hypothetical protein
MPRPLPPVDVRISPEPEAMHGGSRRGSFGRPGVQRAERIRDAIAGRTKSTVDQRAVGLSDVMSNGAAIFSNQPMPGTNRELSRAERHSAASRTFERSRTASRFDYFISHSWAAGRWAKYAGLIYRFNMVPALVAMHLTGLCTCIMYVMGVLPPMATADYGDRPIEQPFGAYCQLLGQAVFVAVLLGWGGWWRS